MGKENLEHQQRHDLQLASSQNEGMALSLWIIGFLDLLGYRNTLEKFDVFPLPSDPQAGAALNTAFGRAVKLRRRLVRKVEDFLNDFKDVKPNNPSHLSPEQKKQMATWQRVKFVCSPGPDHLVIGCSLSQAEDHFPMRALHALVVTAAWAMLFQLSLGAEDPDDTVPLRGGIDIGAGELIQPENFLYSPALTRAYDLESRHAIYARTIAGPRLLDYLAAHVDSDEKTPEAEYNRKLASRIRSCFFTDRDSVLALDFMGTEMRSYVDPSDAVSMAGQAWKYVNEAHRKLRAMGKYDVAAKYSWLLDYMRDRLPLWGVAPGPA